MLFLRTLDQICGQDEPKPQRWLLCWRAYRQHEEL
ncbi:hypothetical protein Mgra_00000962 [Meloidogyne graminicola]|uniref:Uncharacterized protein n=1 Tax=Meloidogyne graminicola TaxID=189291 RepID=A0A8T0A1B8_9BILA|nr:hypothetical protein Mgra_00000962 [Meloidogyne graminicola]